MNLFLSKLTGKLLTTEKFEQSIAQKMRDAKRYREVEQSAELAEYNRLKTIVTDPQFIQNKRDLIKCKYKDTAEYSTHKEYLKMLNNPALQLYMRVKDSKALKEYQEFLDSDEAFLLQDRKAVRKDARLRKMKAYAKSRDYKTFVRFNGTEMPDRFLELKQEVESEDFKKRNAFWSNPHRWETTEEYKQDKRYETLSQNKDILWFLDTDPHQIEYYESFTTLFDEEFKWKTLEDSAWKAGFKYAHKEMKSVHSYVEHKQAYSGGKNTKAQNGKLRIITRLESSIAAAWDTTKGFVKNKFNYTSDIIQSADAFHFKGGLIMAKIRCTGKLHHAFWLGNTQNVSKESIFHFNGKHITVGNIDINDTYRATIRGINHAEFYVYSLMWNKDELIWYVNNKEVFRCTSDVPWVDMYLAFSSWIDAKQKGSNGELVVDWVRVYQQK